mmetsp:Transcript_14611/g.16789  ORF Transcript_14611/g.16789 Transcript_14611/m.16789 type:complete len:137 (-) Transcript_14611:6-416(-)
MGDPFVRPGLSYAPEVEAVLLGQHGTMGSMTSVHDWIESQHRDTLASLVLHDDELQLQCLVENVCPQRMRRMLLERLVNPTRKVTVVQEGAVAATASVPPVLPPPSAATSNIGSGAMAPPPMALPHRPVFPAPSQT